MPVIKCKMCGGDLNIVEGSSICECDYCGTKQTVPNADNEKKITLFTRASRLLRNCEFDKASGVFESIVADFPEEAEAYWGLLLCKYGIEYVDDPTTGKKVPTCHRSSFDSVEDDIYYEQACENADAIARRLYREEARQIETLRKRILEVSGKEEPYDIFISYKELDGDGERTVDSVIAQDIYKALNKEGYRVFFSRISLEGKLGIEYEPYIFAALNSAKVMIVVGTDYDHFDAVWVKNEWSRFLKLIADGRQKTIIPVYKDMDPYDLPKELRSLSAQNMGKIGAMQDLLHGIEKLIPRKTATEKIVEKTVIQSEGSMKTDAAVKRGKLALEEREWEKAKQYFDQALSLDAECAEAYFCIALADDRSCDENEYIQKACSRSVKSQEYTLAKDEVHIMKMIQDYEVSGLLTADEIRKYYARHVTYRTEVKDCREVCRQEEKRFRENKNFKLAFRFAKGEYEEHLEKCSRRLSDALNKRIQEAERQAERAKREAEESYSSLLEEADERVKETFREIMEEREEIYKRACSALEGAKNEQEYRDAQRLFEEAGDYMDSVERQKQCQQNINQITEQALAQRYIKACEKQKKAKTVADYKIVISELKEIAEYKDCSQRIQDCEQVIGTLLEAERLEKEKTEKILSAKKKRTKTILSILAVLAVAAYFVVTKVVIPEQQRSVTYQEASTLYSQGKYSEAISIFQGLGEYKNSLEKVKEIEAVKKEADYQTVATLYAQGKYDEAISLLQQLGEYKDSQEKVIEIEAAKKEAVYQEATKLYSAGDFSGAYSKFFTLSGYKDVNTLLNMDKNLILEAYKKIGNVVTFGAYEQDDNTTNGKEAIEWIVLVNEGNKSLLTSQYALDCQPYNKKNESVIWETCSLRSWLNDIFLNTAFSAEEKEAILTTSVDNSKSQGYSEWSAFDENITSDQIFLLSYAEVGKYFNSQSSRICKPTAFAITEGTFTTESGDCGWWLRSPGPWSSAMIVSREDGSCLGTYVYYDDFAVRPAFWIDLESEYFQ